MQGRNKKPSRHTHKLSPTEGRFSTFDRELLAAFQAVKHFRFFLESRSFTLFTDHKPLVAAISKNKTPFSSCQQRHLSFLSEFTTNFVRLPGKENIVADCLSRPPTLPPTYATPPPPLPINATAPVTLFPLPLSYPAIAKAQATCPSIPALLNNSSLTITSIPISPDLTLLGDVSTPIFRPLIPLSFQKPVFDHVHLLGHPGIRATRRLLSSRFVWSHMSADTAIWSRQCMSCQKAKIHKHVTPPATAIPLPERRFSHVHVDIVGPLPPSQGNTHIFTMVDRTTR